MNFRGSPTVELCATVKQHLHQSHHAGVVNLDAGDFGSAHRDRQCHPLKQREIHVDVEGLCFETGKTVRDADEFVPQLPQILQPFVQAEILHPVHTDLHPQEGAELFVHAAHEVVAVDAHPFVVPRVRKYLERELGLDEPTRMKWLRHWLDLGTRTFEDMLSHNARSGIFCYGNALTIADVCLVAHLTSAKMLYDCNLDLYPTVQRIFKTCMEIDAFTRADPLQQPDAPRTM